MHFTFGDECQNAKSSCYCIGWKPCQIIDLIKEIPQAFKKHGERLPG